MSTAAQPQPRPRADAERNRRRVLDAATQVFAEHGPTATLNDVARSAGVGIGTIYRKFPDKQSLLDALLDDKVGAIMQIVDDAAVIPDPGEAFRHYLSGIVELHARDRSLSTVLFGPDRFDRFPPHLSERLASTADRLIANAIAAGELRPGFTRQDTIAIAVMISTIAMASRDADPELWRRYAELILEGARPSSSATPLLSAPPEFRTMTEALSRVL